jgi:hypothetical protein
LMTLFVFMVDFDIATLLFGPGAVPHGRSRRASKQGN